MIEYVKDGNTIKVMVNGLLEAFINNRGSHYEMHFPTTESLRSFKRDTLEEMKKFAEEVLV